MKKLQDLTQNIKRWNMMGNKTLPLLSLVLIASHETQAFISPILKDFECSLAESALQQTYIMHNGVIGQITVLEGLHQQRIKDQEFRQRKKRIQMAKRSPETLIISFSKEEQAYLHKNQEHLQMFGLAPQSHSRNILFEGSKERLYFQILFKYEGLFKFQLVNCYKAMKELKKEFESKGKRYKTWKSVLQGKVDPVAFSLLSLKQYTDAMKCSFRGIYWSETFVRQSIHWKVMELLNELWVLEKEQLFQEIDQMPLNFIEEQYKMSDYYSIGGFISDTCFKSIFSPPLHRFKRSILKALNTIKYLVLNHIEASISYVFENTSICELFLTKEIENIEILCDKFIDNFQKTLESQIQYIHVDGEQFWNFRQLNTSFYSPDQQIYIQIKYIGKTYVKKVYESIRESVPRYIGQNLLKETVKYLTEESLNTFIEITREKPFQIVIDTYEHQKFLKNAQNLQEISKIINFFSLRVNSSFLIKNFYEKKEKEWRRMIGRAQEPEQPGEVQQPEEKGIIAWMKKKLLGSNNRRRRRLKSTDKKVQVKVEEPKKTNLKTIDQKHWLLIINTGKEVNEQKIKLSAAEGFPVRFRSSIWMYLATSTPTYKKYKVKDLLKTQVDEKTQLQIQKDVVRTHPSNLFRKSLKSPLTRVLHAYSVYDKEVNYTQGMNFIAGMILLLLTGYGRKDNHLVDDKKMTDEELQDKTFWIFRYLMEDKNIRKLMLVDAQLMVDLFLRLEERIRELSPLMSSKIEESGFNCQMFFSSPLLSCLTTSQINYSLQMRVLDVVIANDFVCVYKIIAQFVAHAEFKADTLSLDNIFDFLKNKIYDEVYEVVGDDGITRLMKSL